MNLSYDKIKITSFKKTVKFNDQWWNVAYKLIKNDLNNVIEM